jgi:serine protease
VSTPEQLVRILADDSVEYATLDRRRYPHAVPNDPLYAGSTGQWYLQTNATNLAAINAEQAWDTTTGSSSVVIAVIDTGVRYDHPDLGAIAQGGRLLPGYDFISDSRMSNDGDARDADASDSGDFLTQADKDANSTFFQNCDVGNSSWHGTRVAGIIGARTNNAEGIAGATWSPSILPVRVLGKCGGFDSDIIAGMLWAAGIHVNGVPDNPFPAQIENMSLGATGVCGQAYSDAIAAVAARGAVVVVSAGNEGGPVDEPANCPGAVGVAGLRHIGTKVGFSSLGNEVALSAPGGNCVNVNGGPCLFPINTTTNLGATTPGANGYSDQLNPSVGTSFSAPIVSGIAGLMLSVNGHLGAAQLRSRLREGAVKPFPVSSDPTIPMCHVPTSAADVQASECSCTTGTCGAGIANAPGAVLAALRPIAVVVPPTTVSPGQSVTLPAGTSTAATGHTIASYAWTGSIAVTPPDQATGVLLAPTSGSAQVCVTVTDDAGRQDTAEVLLTPTSATMASIAGNTNPCAVLPVTVTVAPSTVTIQTNATQQFTATVANSTNTAVNWSVNNVPGGNATVGTVSATGLYTPPSVTSNLVVSVSAAWVGDPSRVGSAQVTVIPIPVTVDVTPGTATVLAGGTQQFSAVVSNSSNSAVNWSVNGIAGGDAGVGTVSAAGLYTAPTSVSASTVVAVTAAWSGDATRMGSSSVTVNPIPMQVPPQQSSSGGGGGGAFGLVELVGLAAVGLLRRRRAPRA